MSKKFETNVIKPEVTIKRDEKELRLIDADVEANLDENIQEALNFIKNNTGKGKSNSEKDNLYLESQKLHKNFTQNLEKSKYNFYLNKNQWKFLTELILKKLEYDVNTVFFAIELRDLFDVMKTTKYSGDEYISFSVNATEVTYIYHLISKHKVVGLTQDSYRFSEILLLIGSISKIFNYYDATSKNLSTDIQDWVVTFEDGVDFENRETVQAQIL
jgi:hypothetical protein